LAFGDDNYLWLGLEQELQLLAGETFIIGENDAN
jgi:hypothetical protein